MSCFIVIEGGRPPLLQTSTLVGRAMLQAFLARHAHGENHMVISHASDRSDPQNTAEATCVECGGPVAGSCLVCGKDLCANCLCICRRCGKGWCEEHEGLSRHGTCLGCTAGAA